MARRSLTTTLSALMAAMVALGVGACAEPAAPTDSNITIRVGAIPGAWDPFQGYILELVGRSVYEPLFDGEGGLIPRLASDVVVADDGLSVSVSLPEDVEFTDGEHLDAPFVVDYLSAVLRSEAFPRKTDMDKLGVQVEVTGEYSLEFTSEKPMRELWFKWIGEIPIISPAAFEDPTLLEDGPIGTGPYLIDEIVPEVSVTLVRNPAYRDPATFEFDEVTMMIYEDDIAALNALKSGELDAASISDLALVEEARSSGLSVFANQGVLTYIFFVDRKGAKVPALADVRVRKAINLALDREAINETINFGLGKHFRDLGIFAQFDHIGYDLDRARQLMKEAGYEDGFDLTISALASEDDYRPIIEQSLGDIGIRVTFDVTPDSEGFELLLTRWPSGEFPATLLSFVPDFELGAGAVHFFYGGYADYPDLQEKYELFENGTPAESVQADDEIESTMLDEAWYAPIASRPTFYVANSSFKVEPYPTSYFAYLEQYTWAE